MSVANMSIEHSTSQVVDAMLPRMSGQNLGLLIRIRMEASDFGYGEDGNTRERPPQSHRKCLNFLFVRSSNYTKVFLYEPNQGEYVIVGKELVWDLQSDHDSCWRTDGMRRITDVYFELCNPICLIQKCPPAKVHSFNGFDNDPQYVELETFERVHPEADRFSSEGRPTRIKMKSIGFDRLVQHKYMDKGWKGKMQEFKTGLLIKDSECDIRFQNSHNELK